ncbi:MAG: BMP family ABC transporter substrate-binding protein [Clostridiales bacterium]|nr:BMP family ABC transporter substrate-binding protein [Clostridiales bacterium]MDD6935578.1 BMP family ABC transporter substrate-binding protein [Clostridiales bacterium]MDY2961768.1 BMP family ABC transporter substrate-binding protein [Oscillospiraceae bacterium]
MKRTIALLLALVMVFALCACGNKEEAKPSDNAAESEYRVAMITDYGDITDQSFNQTTYEACKAFCEENSIDFTYYKPAGDNTPDRIAMVEKAVDEGYNVIVMPGFAFAGAISGTQDQYPDVKFIALDVSEYDITSSFYKTDANGNVTDELLDPNNKPHIASNVYSAVYQEELCGYMAGYAAVKLGYTKLGFLGGMAVPAVQRYGYGFVQGCDAAAAELNTTVDVKYAYGNQFFGDADITAAMDTWYGSGTEVVFACGGGIYTSAVDAAKKVEGAKVIGVDVDQAGVIADYSETEGMTVTSAMKGLAPTVKTMLTETILNNNWDKYAGKVETLGLVSGDDPEANYVQIPMESTQWADGKFTQDDYKALVKAMFDGTVKVSSDISAMPATTAAHVEDLGNIK